MEYVLWLSGGAGAGKTTIADEMASRLGWDVYHYHERTRDHVGRATPQSQPLLHAFLAMDMNERWLHRAPAVMFQTLPESQGERIGFIIEDVLKIPGGRPVIVEGWGLFPRFVGPFLSSPSQALWLIPSEGFCAFALEARGELWTIPNKTSNPRRARSNWREREKLVKQEMKAQANKLGLRVVEVDHESLANMCEIVHEQFRSYTEKVSMGPSRSP